MIEFVQGDIFESGCEVLVNPVNCKGVMGKGLALQFKRRYPEMFDIYLEACQVRAIRPGGLSIYNLPSENYPLKYILNLPLKTIGLILLD
jgi:O-acetyl-ADP-ribose deacetylase (regulator of RNase III)